MDKKIEHLAQCRQVEAACKAVVEEIEAELKESDLWAYLERRRELLAIAKEDVADAEADIERDGVEVEGAMETSDE